MTGNGGDLQVWVLESDGTIQTFNVPFTTPAIALREGYLKYNVTVGEYRPSDDSIEGAYLGQLTAMYGLPWSLTAFGGIQVSEHYQGNALGLGLSLGGFGSISLDTIYSRGQQKGYSNEMGKTWRVRYDKSFELTGTSFAAGYQDSSAGYHSLADVLDTYRNGTAYRSYDNRIRRTTINISQALGIEFLDNLYSDTLIMLKSCEIDFNNPPAKAQEIISAGDVPLGTNLRSVS